MLDTMDTEKKRVRRNHSAELKAQVVAECELPGASVAKVAMAHGINANIVHGWRRLARQAMQPSAVPAFLPVRIEPSAPLASAAVSTLIDIELRRGALSVRIAWPLPAAAEFGAWMRDVLREPARGIGSS
jgi:transposase